MSCGFNSTSMRCNKKSNLNKKWCKQTKYCRKSAKGKKESPKKKRTIFIKDKVICGFDTDTDRCNQQSKLNSNMCYYNKDSGFCQRKKFIDKENRKVSENLKILEKEGRILLEKIKNDSYKHNSQRARKNFRILGKKIMALREFSQIRQNVIFKHLELRSTKLLQIILDFYKKFYESDEFCKNTFIVDVTEQCVVIESKIKVVSLLLTPDENLGMIIPYYHDVDNSLLDIHASILKIVNKVVIENGFLLSSHPRYNYINKFFKEFDHHYHLFLESLNQLRTEELVTQNPFNYKSNGTNNDK
jgi:hypothetical protein